MCTCDQDGDGLDLADVEFNEIPNARKWSLSIPLASFKAPEGKAKKLPRKLKKKLKKQAYSIAITELPESADWAAHNHMAAWSQLAESQRQRAQDMYAIIRKELDDTFSVNVPGVLSTDDIVKVLAETIAGLKPHAADPDDIKVEQDKNDPNIYHFTYTLQTQTPPVYTITLTKPANITDAAWREYVDAMKTEIDLITAQLDDNPRLSAAEEAEEAVLRG